MSDEIQEKKLPPFGKPLYELLKAGFRPNNDVKLFIGIKAWEKGKAFSVSYPAQTLILPPWVSPFSYIWPVKQCDILIFDTGYAQQVYLEELIYCLHMDGANKVRSICPVFKFSVYEKDI